MNKENLIELLKKGYSFLLTKGMNSTVAKIIIGAIFGAVCALCFSSCAVSYSDNERSFEATILKVQEGGK